MTYAGDAYAAAPYAGTIAQASGVRLAERKIGSGTTCTLASTPAAGSTVVLALSSTTGGDSAGQPVTYTASGGGGTWTKIHSVASATGQTYLSSHDVWVGTGLTSASISVTATGANATTPTPVYVAWVLTGANASTISATSTVTPASGGTYGGPSQTILANGAALDFLSVGDFGSNTYPSSTTPSTGWGTALASGVVGGWVNVKATERLNDTTQTHQVSSTVPGTPNGNRWTQIKVDPAGPAPASPASAAGSLTFGGSGGGAPSSLATGSLSLSGVSAGSSATTGASGGLSLSGSVNAGIQPRTIALGRASRSSTARLLTVAQGQLIPDYFANPERVVISVDGGTYTSGSISTSTATMEAGEPQPTGYDSGKSLWWEYVPATSGTISLNTTLGAGDSEMAVYTGSSLGTLTKIASDSDSGTGLTSVINNLAVSAGVVYHIQVAAFQSQDITVVLRVTGPASLASGARVLAIGRASRASVARYVGAIQPRTIALGRASRSGTARTLTLVQGLAPGAPQFVPIGRATRTSVTRPLTRIYNQQVAIGRAVRQGLARTLTYATGVLYADSFNRPAPVGTPDTGGPYSYPVSVSTHFTIVDGALRAGVAGGPMYMITTVGSQIDATLTLKSIGTEGAFLFRYASLSQYWSVRWAVGVGMWLHAQHTSVVTAQVGGTVPIGAGDTIRVVARDKIIQVHLNGLLVLEAEDHLATQGTSVGFRFYNDQVSEVDNIFVRTLLPETTSQMDLLDQGLALILSSSDHDAFIYKGRDSRIADEGLMA